MRELPLNEIKQVSGGLNVPGALGAIVFGWQIGWNTGMAINSFNSSQGRTLGRTVYTFTH